MGTRTIQGFLLTRSWADTGEGVQLEYWFATPEGARLVRIPGERSVFFLRQSDQEAAKPLVVSNRQLELRPLPLTSFDGQPVTAVYSPSHKAARQLSDRLADRNIECLEADINPADRYLMERFISGSAEIHGDWTAQGLPASPCQIRAGSYQPEFRVLSLDIETAMHELSLFSIGVHSWGSGEEQRRVFMVGNECHQDEDWIEYFPDQRALLTRFLDWLAESDPDVIIGWNVVNFDLWYLQRVAEAEGIALKMGRLGSEVYWRSLDEDGERRAARLSGRVVLDGIELLRAAFYRFESFSLNHVAGEILGDSKLLHGSGRGEEIAELFVSDKPALARYNLKDCLLVSEIFQREGLLAFAIARSTMTGLNIDRLGASVAAFDNLYLPRLHRAGFVAPNAPAEPPDSPGGFVLDSQPGIYSHVLVLDFKSLYPSIIRSFHIDPLGLALGVNPAADPKQSVPGFRGGRFAREGHILPGLIERLWQLRDEAKASGNQALSQAIKIIMNSFYGVLGSPGCRFFDPRLASSITLRGHEILQQSRDYIERAGHRVIYGDTDSVFVWIHTASNAEQAAAAGKALEADLNQWWSERLTSEFGLVSALELEFETHFLRFLMPTVRGSDKGSKKRYAGIVEAGGELRTVFKGLENVRTDWTRLARQFQEELYERVFREQPYESYVKQTAQSLSAGECDDLLVYRKRLRRRLQDYQRNVPPHVQAARLYEERGLARPRRGDWVEYVITQAGAEPVLARQSPLDYQHYRDKQLAPVADGILSFLGTSFAALTDQQITLF